MQSGNCRRMLACLLWGGIALGAGAQQAAAPAAHNHAPASAAGAPAVKPPEPPPPQIHAWQTPPPSAGGTAYFTNLQDGASIETPYLLKFGLSGGWGIAPISKPLGGKSGHHHLLVNRDLPLDFKQPLPFNAQYIHFGKGQMETLLDLAPGKYTLRLLLADHQHLPHFVYSPPVSVTVTRKSGADAQKLVTKGIQLLLPAPGTRAPFPIRFHASGLNVGFVAQKETDTGHFRLTLTPAKGKPEVLDFRNGQTEVWLAPPAGEYTARLEFLDNTKPDAELAPAVSGVLRVPER